MKTQTDQLVELAQKDIKDMEHNVGVYKKAITAYKKFQSFVKDYTLLGSRMDVELYSLSKNIDTSIKAVTDLGIDEDLLGFSPGHLTRQFKNPQTIKLAEILKAIDKGMDNLQLAQKNAEERIARRTSEVNALNTLKTEEEIYIKEKRESEQKIDQTSKSLLQANKTSLASILNGASDELSVTELQEVLKKPDLRAKAIEAIQHDKKGEVVINDKMAEALFGITKEAFKVEDYATIYKQGGKELAALDKALEAVKGKDVLEQLKSDRREFVQDNKGLQTARDKVGIKVEHIKEKFAEKFSRSSNDKDKSHAERVKSKQGAEKDSKGRV